METIIAILGSGVISTIISCIFQYINQKKTNQTQFETGMSLLLLSSLKRDGKDLLAQGSVSKNDYDSFMATYKAYKSLGGDGWADGIKDDVDHLKRNFVD